MREEEKREAYGARWVKAVSQHLVFALLDKYDRERVTLPGFFGGEDAFVKDLTGFFPIVRDSFAAKTEAQKELEQEITIINALANMSWDERLQVQGEHLLLRQILEADSQNLIAMAHFELEEKEKARLIVLLSEVLSEKRLKDWLNKQMLQDLLQLMRLLQKSLEKPERGLWQKLEDEYYLEEVKHIDALINNRLECLVALKRELKAALLRDDIGDDERRKLESMVSTVEEREKELSSPEFKALSKRCFNQDGTINKAGVAEYRLAEQQLHKKVKKSLYEHTENLGGVPDEVTHNLRAIVTRHEDIDKEIDRQFNASKEKIRKKQSQLKKMDITAGRENTAQTLYQLGKFIAQAADDNASLAFGSGLERLSRKVVGFAQEVENTHSPQEVQAVIKNFNKEIEGFVGEHLNMEPAQEDQFRKMISAISELSASSTLLGKQELVRIDAPTSKLEAKDENVASSEATVSSYAKAATSGMSAVPPVATVADEPCMDVSEKAASLKSSSVASLSEGSENKLRTIPIVEASASEKKQKDFKALKAEWSVVKGGSG